MIGYDLSPGKNGRLLEESISQPANERDTRTFIKAMPLQNTLANKVNA
jgi:hypothetical protein